MPSGPLNELAELLREAAQVRFRLVQPEPTAASCARFDLDHAERVLGTSLPIRRVIVSADLWTVISGNQLRGVGALLVSGDSLFALFPILRSVMEHSAAVAWVLDDTADSRTRGQRGAVATLRSEQEAVQASAKMGGKDSETYKAARTRYRATQKAVRSEFGSLTDDHGWVVDGVTLPSPTALIEHFGERWGDLRQWSGMYDYFCLTANHPSHSAFEYAIQAEDGSTGFSAPRDLVERMVRAALVPFLKSLEYFCGYMGWDDTAVNEFIDRVNALLGDVLTDGTSLPTRQD